MRVLASPSRFVVIFPVTGAAASMNVTVLYIASRVESSKSSSAGHIIGINNPQQAVFPAVCFFFALHFEISRRARLVYTSYVAVTGIDITYEISKTKRTLVVYATVTPTNATDRRIIYTSSADNSNDDWYMDKEIAFTYDPDVDAGTAMFTIKYVPESGSPVSVIFGHLSVMVVGHSETKKEVSFSYNALSGFKVRSIS